MVRLPPLTSRGKPHERKNPLEVKFQFDPEVARAVQASVGTHAANRLVSQSLHIKGLGYDRKQIAETAMELGQDAGNLSSWQAIASLVRPSNGDTKVAVAAYRAGLSPIQLESMDPAMKTLERLRLMSDVRSL